MSNPTQKPNTWETIREGWALLTERERKLTIIFAIAITFLSMIDTVALGATLPLITLTLEPDKVYGNPYFDTIWTFLGKPEHKTMVGITASLVVFLLITSTIFNILIQHMADRFNASCCRRLSTDLLRECIGAPYSWHLGRNATKLSRLLNFDVSIWGRDFVRYILVTFSDVVSILLISSMVVLLMPALGLAAIVGVVFLSGGMLALARPRVHRYAQLKKKSADETVFHSYQAISGVKDVKLSSKEEQFIEVFGDAVHQSNHAYVWSSFWSRLPPLQMVLLGQLGLVTVTISLWLMEISSGEIASYLAVGFMISSRVIPTINRVTSTSSSLWNVAPFTRGISELVAEIRTAARNEPGTSSTAQAPKDWRTLNLQHVDFTYSGVDTPAIHDVSLQFERNKIYGVVGTSGAGKSTLIDLLIGLFVPSQGSINIDDSPLTEFDTRSWQAQIGYVPQSPYMLDTSLRDNVALNFKRKDRDDALVLETLHAAHLGDFLAGLPNGIDTAIGDRGSRISGGQKQRIALARALFKRPSILILDEATSALDSVSEERIRQVLHDLRGHVTTVMIAHRLSTLKDVDKIFLMDQGSLIDSGTYDELFERNAKFKHMASLQGDTTTQPVTA